MIPLIWIIAGIAGAVGLGAAAAASDEEDKRKKALERKKENKRKKANMALKRKDLIEKNKKLKKDFDSLIDYLVNLDIYIDTNIWMHSNDEFFELLDIFLTNFNKKIIMSKVEYDEKIKVKVDAKTNSNQEAIRSSQRAITLIDKFQKRGLLEIKNIQKQTKSAYADDFYIDLANKKSDFFVITKDRDLSIRLNAIRTEKTSEDKIEFNLQRLNSVDAKEFELLVRQYYLLDYSFAQYNLDPRNNPKSLENPMPSRNSVDFYINLNKEEFGFNKEDFGFNVQTIDKFSTNPDEEFGFNVQIIDKFSTNPDYAGYKYYDYVPSPETEAKLKKLFF